MSNFETLESLRFSAQKQGVILPLAEGVKISKNEYKKNEIQPVKNERFSQSFLNQSNQINSRLDFLDKKRENLILKIAYDLKKGTPDIESIFSVVEISLEIESNFSRYDNPKFKRSGSFKNTLVKFGQFVEEYKKEIDEQSISYHHIGGKIT